MSIRITDPELIARLERRQVGGAMRAKAQAAIPSKPTPEPHQKAQERKSDQIRVDDRLKPSTALIEAAVRACPETRGKFRSKLEGRFAARLEALQATGEICRWWYEPATFRLPGGHWYTPDFVLERPDGTLEWVETKGYLWRHDALRIDAFRDVFKGLNYRVEGKC